MTAETLAWDHHLKDYNPVVISDGTLSEQYNDLLKDPSFVRKVFNGEVTKFEGYADPPLVDGKLSMELRQELEQGTAERLKLLDGKVVKVNVNRRSHTGKLTFDPETNLPRNPLGRTGLVGRGFLGRYGPNHAADALVLRFCPRTGHLQAALAFRDRDKKWVISGGMVDFDENAIHSLLRELDEETCLDLKKQLKDYFFSSDPHEGESIFKESESMTSWVATKRVVDDNRNTDSSWMETLAVVILLNDELGASITKFDPKDTEEIGTASWIDLTPAFLSSQTVHKVEAGGKTYEETLWDTHHKLLNALVQQVVDRGYAKLSDLGYYVKC